MWVNSIERQSDRFVPGTTSSLEILTDVFRPAKRGGETGDAGRKAPDSHERYPAFGK